MEFYTFTLMKRVELDDYKFDTSSIITNGPIAMTSFQNTFQFFSVCTLWKKRPYKLRTVFIIFRHVIPYILVDVTGVSQRCTICFRVKR
jgi:hypothetical protein